jgi:hypothetical protein
MHRVLLGGENVIMQRLRGRFSAQPADAGLGITEVVAAVMIFAVIAVGMAYAMVTMTRLTGDTRQREVAAALATQEIDKVRSIADAFKVTDQTSTQTVGGTTYTVTRQANWVSTTGSTANCGGGSGNLQYKGVQVIVTWPGMMVLDPGKTASQVAVKANTDLAPATRVNDPSYGTIIVSVLGADGTGRAGVGITVTQKASGAAVGSVAATDADGCSYVLKVTPGTYTVTASAAGYIDYHQTVSPSQDLTVTAGSSQTAFFAYDKQATYRPVYAANFSVSGQTPKLPDAMVTNYQNTQWTSQATTPSAITRYPYPDGYSVVAGTYASTTATTSVCLSVDPTNWPAGTVGGVNLAAGVSQPSGVAPGGTGSVNVPMGVVKLTWPSGTSVTATMAPPPAGTGDPGCAQPTSYTFTYTTAPSTGSTVYLALPFGSWQLTGKVAGVVGVLPTGSLAAATQGEVTGTVVTLDARLPQ